MQFSLDLLLWFWSPFISIRMRLLQADCVLGLELNVSLKALSLVYVFKLLVWKSGVALLDTVNFLVLPMYMS